MEYTLFTETRKELEKVARHQESILVAFSGGKDSWVCLDLCCKIFKRVVCFFLFFVPDLECVEIQLERARQRYGVEIRQYQYPHWLFFRCIKYGVYCDTHWKDRMDVWEPKLNDIYKAIIADTGIDRICSGMKGTDSLWCRRHFAINKLGKTLYPLKKWQRIDIISYLRMNQIDLPDAPGKNSWGIDLSTPTLLYLHDKFPDDFQRLLTFFPYAEAAVYKRMFYGA